MLIEFSDPLTVTIAALSVIWIYASNYDKGLISYGFIKIINEDV